METELGICLSMEHYLFLSTNKKPINQNVALKVANQRASSVYVLVSIIVKYIVVEMSVILPAFATITYTYVQLSNVIE